MNRLYLLGFTHDLKGVVFSQRKGGKSATLWVPVDETFLDAIDKLERARTEQKGGGKAGGKGGKGGKGAKAKASSEPEPEPSRRLRRDAETGRVVLPPVGRSQSSSRLTVAEIQQMLREGRSVKAVVEASKAPQSWVERLLEPVLTERAGVIRLAQRAVMSRPRLGRSGLPVGDAVIRNLEERRATSDTIEGIDDAWDARASQGRWRVWIKFNHRGKRRTAEWEFLKSTREVKPRNRLAAQLGWWAPEEEAEAESHEGVEEDGPDRGEESDAAPKRRPAPRKRRSRKPAPRRTAAKRKPAKRKPAKRSAARKPAKRPSGKAASRGKRKSGRRR